MLDPLLVGSFAAYSTRTQPNVHLRGQGRTDAHNVLKTPMGGVVPLGDPFLDLSVRVRVLAHRFWTRKVTSVRACEQKGAMHLIFLSFLMAFSDKR